MPTRQYDEERRSATTFYLCLAVLTLACLLAIVLAERFL
jgi:hypothetical protein